ncbi:MAG: DUF2284 domain-containing protein, partial [Candidatus Hodarchaeota archaeon]
MMVDVKPFTEIKVQKIKKETIYFNKNVREYCKLKYKGHPNGCPNYNNNKLCPPQSPYLENEILNNYNYYYLIYAVFNLKEYKEEMRKIHNN